MFPFQVITIKLSKKMIFLHSFLYLKIVEIYFPVAPSFGPFWSVKYFNFEQKLPIRTAHHTFLESPWGY